MKRKIYIFTNQYTTYREGKGWKQVEVEAETILEAKKKIKDMGHDDLEFISIKFQCNG